VNTTLGGGWQYVSEERETYGSNDGLLRFGLPNVPDLFGNKAGEQRKTGEAES